MIILHAIDIQIVMLDKKDDIIVVNDMSISDYDAIVDTAVRYAILSLPFTIDRMKIPHVSRRVMNIAKGKLAEGLFGWFCIKNKIKVDMTSCETPFYQVDKRDFLFLGYEWDIKNNLIYPKNEISYLDLPALIPNRHQRDQWSTRNEKKIKTSKGVKYLFTFMKVSDLGTGKNFIDITLDERQVDILQKLYQKYKGLSQASLPFSVDDFWAYFLKSNTDLFRLDDRPELIITGYADESIWHLFKNTGPKTSRNYKSYTEPYWYKKTGKYDSLSWLDGVLWTKITNETVPVRYLKSFADLIS